MYKFNPFTGTLDEVGGSTGSTSVGIESGATDPASPSNYTFFYNTTEQVLKVYLFDTWVTFIDFKDIMLTDPTGDIITDPSGNPIFETNTINFVRE